MIGALTTADPRIGVAQAMIDGPSIRYVGAQSTACTPDPSLPQTAYRANPAAIRAMHSQRRPATMCSSRYPARRSATGPRSNSGTARSSGK
jgi:hypothetical protein